jgi:hypothetical protein
MGVFANGRPGGLPHISDLGAVPRIKGSAVLLGALSVVAKGKAPRPSAARQPPADIVSRKAAKILSSFFVLASLREISGRIDAFLVGGVWVLRETNCRKSYDSKD